MPFADIVASHLAITRISISVLYWNCSTTLPRETFTTPNGTIYALWSIDSEERYQMELERDKNLSPLTSFAMETLDPKFRSMKCSFEYKQGCVNMSTLIDVRIARKEERHSARAILYTLLIHQRAFADTHIFVGAINAARKRLQG
jgi:hypothetical protein